MFTFLLTIVGKETIDLGNAKLSMSFFLIKKCLISSDIVVLTHVLIAETCINRFPISG